MRNGHRVVISGLGAVSPIGIGVEKMWNAMLEGRQNFGPITKFDTEGYSVRFGAEVSDFDPTLWMEKKEVRRVDLYAQFAIAASVLCMDHSGLDHQKVDPNRFGVIIGSGIGGMETMEKQHAALMNKGPGRVSPFFIPMMIANIASGRVSIRFNAKGPNYAPVTACASGAHAIGEAFRIIQSGDADIMLCGGAEAALTPMGVAGFSNMKALSIRNDDPARSSRPFDLDRDGFVIGEGAGVVLLETLEHAEKRGAHIYAELSGYGRTSDAFHITAPTPDGDGAARAMTLAVQDAGMNRDEIDHINAHGTSTPLNDVQESRGIRLAFGEHADNILVNSTKSMTGHLLGAAGGIELIATALTLERGVVPPTINYETPDPDCDLTLVTNEAREAKIRAALTNSLGFGGHNASILLKRFES